MDLWQLIANDHANIADLCGEIPRAFPDGGVRSRERLFSDLDTELRRHLEAEEESLYDALEDHDRAEHLVAELEHEHEEIERWLGELARMRDKGSPEWTQRFRDLDALIEGHFHREEQELLPLARELLGEEEVRELRHEYVEENIEALRARHGGWNVPSSGLLLGALVGAAVGAVAFAAWRTGALRGLAARTPTQFLLSRAPVLGRLSRLGRGGRAVRQYGADVLKEVAQRTRTSVQDISSRLRLPLGTTYAVVAALERQGLVRSAGHQGPARGRVVAITTRGREESRH
ncbi:hemerythrin-like domain-containing protein [Microvirga flocculans]|uniref:Hemerythrin-like domain-containing protein n=1 Tax=Microvirga flocculans TaxID=217168 RepID=A0A7W6N7V4_9HYPH|nr:hemerythrin domain-containing protein [Microvirga flocculans]MBB4039885.1 hemerythrin-like domain-containing protein [Microvirga flocculans]